jgi:hypothetical protein
LRALSKLGASSIFIAMPRVSWPIDGGPLVQGFEAKHRKPNAGALFMWAIWSVESLHYLDDLDKEYDSSRGTIAGHPGAIIDVAHCRWATGTCITALDLCAAGLGNAFCNHPGPPELSVADFGPRARDGKMLRSRLPLVALQWIDAVRSDRDYERVKDARHWLTHSRVPRHFKLGTGGGRPSRLELEIGSMRLGVRQLIELARDVATKHVIQFLKELPNL